MGLATQERQAEKKASLHNNWSICNCLRSSEHRSIRPWWLRQPLTKAFASCLLSSGNSNSRPSSKASWAFIRSLKPREWPSSWNLSRISFKKRYHRRPGKPPTTRRLYGIPSSSSQQSLETAIRRAQYRLSPSWRSNSSGWQGRETKFDKAKPSDTHKWLIKNWKRWYITTSITDSRSSQGSWLHKELEIDTSHKSSSEPSKMRANLKWINQAPIWIPRDLERTRRCSGSNIANRESATSKPSPRMSKILNDLAGQVRAYLGRQMTRRAQSLRSATSNSCIQKSTLTICIVKSHHYDDHIQPNFWETWSKETKKSSTRKPCLANETTYPHQQ